MDKALTSPASHGDLDAFLARRAAENPDLWVNSNTETARWLRHVMLANGLSLDLPQGHLAAPHVDTDKTAPLQGPKTSFIDQGPAHEPEQSSGLLRRRPAAIATGVVAISAAVASILPGHGENVSLKTVKGSTVEVNIPAWLAGSTFSATEASMHVSPPAEQDDVVEESEQPNTTTTVIDHVPAIQSHTFSTSSGETVQVTVQLPNIETKPSIITSTTATTAPSLTSPTTPPPSTLAAQPASPNVLTAPTVIPEPVAEPAPAEKVELKTLGNGVTWDDVAKCESEGDWRANTGNGYFGGLQFSQTSWEYVGGTGSPHEASREEQIYRAELLLAEQGWEAWPACSQYLGLRAA